MRILGFSLAFLLVLASCSVEKRHYRSGFYVSKRTSKEIRSVSAPVAKIEKEKPAKVQEVQFYSEPSEKKEPVILASVEKTVYAEKIKDQKKFISSLENCDTIFLTNKTGIKAKVAEITATEIKYRYCDDPNGPLRSVAKYDVRYISYSNGTKEVVTPEYIPPPVSAESQKPRVRRQLNLFALSGFILGILPYPVTLIMLYANLISSIGGAALFSTGAFYFPVMLAVLALILSIVAMVQMSKDKEKYKGWPFAIMGAAFGGAIALIMILIISALP